MKQALPFFCLFLVLATLFPAAGFYDLYLLPWQSRLVFTEHPNLWHAMRDNPAAYLPFTRFSAFPYGPLFYYPMALWVALMDGVRLIDIAAWADFGVATDSMRYTALLKLPNLAAYLAVGMVLRRALPGRGGHDAMLLWLLNPAVILEAFVMGQNDGWSILAVLVALLLLGRALEGDPHVRLGGRRLPAAPLALVVLGIGGAVKLHPLLFVAPFAITAGRSWRERTLLAALALATFGAVISPFVTDSFFREHALFNPQGETLLHHRLGNLPLFYPTYAAAALLPPLLRGRRALLTTLVAVHLLIFGLSSWPPERAAWFIGALALPAALSRPGLIVYVMSTIQVLLVAMGLGNGLGAGVFSLVSERLAQQPGLDAALDRLWDYDAIRTTGLGLGLGAWCLALGVLLRRHTLHPRPVPMLVPVAMISLLPTYFGAAIAYGSGGLTTPTLGPVTGAVSGPAIVEQPFIAGADSLSGLDVVVSPADGGDRLAAALVSDASPTADQAGVGRAPGGYTRIRFDRIADSHGQVYRLRLDLPPGVSVRLVPTALNGFVGEATVDGRPAPGTLDFRQHYDRDWGAIAGDAKRAFRAEAGTVAAVTMVLAAALLAMWWSTCGSATAETEAPSGSRPREG